MHAIQLQTSMKKICKYEKLDNNDNIRLLTVYSDTTVNITELSQ